MRKSLKDSGMGALVINSSVGQEIPNYGSPSKAKKTIGITSKSSVELLTAILEAVRSQTVIQKQTMNNEINVFPRNHFAPEGSDLVELRTLELIPKQSEKEIFSFIAPKSTSVRFIRYAIFTDALLSSDIEFIPRVEGNRILQYHGDPKTRKIQLSIGVDLTDSALIPCDIILRPGQKLTWVVVNRSLQDIPLGIRMSGYVDTRSQTGGLGKFGG